MRLIDVDELKLNIYKNKETVINDALIECIDKTPAYDPEKILKQLKEAAVERNDSVGMGGGKVVKLTKESNKGGVALTFDLDVTCEKSEIMKIMKLAEKIKEYEDAEEQGRLLKLPCKEAYTQTGDTVYLIYENKIIECIHCGLSISPAEGKGYITLCTDKDRFLHKIPDPKNAPDGTDWYTDSMDVEVDEIGKPLFFTREAAEQALKQ